MATSKDTKLFDYGSASDKGLVQKQNEDCIDYFECINGHVFLVCDGIGNHSGGEMAARLTVETIRAYLENHYFDLPEDAMKAAIEYANAVVYKKSRLQNETSDLRTTIAMMMVRMEKAYIAHVGHSRIYILADDRLWNLTKDHLYVQKQNAIEKTAVRTLGNEKNIHVEIAPSPIIPAQNNIIMLCTKPLIDILGEKEIETVLAEDTSIQGKADKLIRLANDKGGHENVSVQLVYFNKVTNKKAKYVPINTTQNLIETIEVINDEATKNTVEKKETLFKEPEPDKSLISDEASSNVIPDTTISENKTEENTYLSIDKSNETDAEPETEQINKEKEEYKTAPVITGASSENSDKSNISNNTNTPENQNTLKTKYLSSKKIKFVLIGVGILFLAYIVWDLFIKPGTNTRLINTPTPQITDTSAQEIKDSVKTTQNAPEPQTSKPETEQKKNNPEKITQKTDTTWMRYSVKKGDVLGSIATKFGVSVNFIRAKNNLTKDIIREKQQLDIPIRTNHQVKSGETLASIAKKYGIDKTRIMKANDITNEKNIKAGQYLIIPFK